MNGEELNNIIHQFGESNLEKLNRYNALHMKDMAPFLKSNYNEVQDLASNLHGKLCKKYQAIKENIESLINNLADFSEAFYDFANASLRCGLEYYIINTLKKTIGSTFELINKYKDLKKEIKGERNKINEIIDLVIYKNQIPTHLKNVNFLLDSNYYNIDGILKDNGDVDKEIKKCLKQKAFYLHPLRLQIEQLEFFRDRFSLLLNYVDLDISRLYNTVNVLIEKKRKAYNKIDQISSIKKDARYTLIDLINSKETYELKDIIEIMKKYNPSHFFFSRDNSLRYNMRGWVFSTGDYFNDIFGEYKK